MRILVTGASGFIGRALCRHLTAANHDLVAAVGTASPTAVQAAQMLQIRLPQDIASESFQQALARCDGLVHLAGVAHQRASAAAYQRVNIETTARLTETAVKLGVSRVIFVSSSLAETANPADVPISYASSKAAAEQAFARCLEGSSTTGVILRPSLVYGPGVRGNLHQLMAAVRRGLPLPPDIGPGRTMIALEDLVLAIERALQQSLERDSGVPCWSLSDGEIYTLRRIVKAFRSAGGLRGDGLSVPLSLWRAACRMRDGLIYLQHGRASGSDSFAQLFGNATTLPAQNGIPGWRPLYRLEDFSAAMWEALA